MLKEKVIAYLKQVFTLQLALGIVLGAIAGYAYYYFIGCNSGTCPITSNPVTMILYGMLFGATLFYKGKKKNIDTQANADETN